MFDLHVLEVTEPVLLADGVLAAIAQLHEPVYAADSTSTARMTTEYHDPIVVHHFVFPIRGWLEEKLRILENKARKDLSAELLQLSTDVTEELGAQVRLIDALGYPVMQWVHGTQLSVLDIQPRATSVWVARRAIHMLMPAEALPQSVHHAGAHFRIALDIPTAQLTLLTSPFAAIGWLPEDATILAEPQLPAPLCARPEPVCLQLCPHTLNSCRRYSRVITTVAANRSPPTAAAAAAAAAATTAGSPACTPTSAPTTTTSLPALAPMLTGSFGFGPLPTRYNLSAAAAQGRLEAHLLMEPIPAPELQLADTPPSPAMPSKRPYPNGFLKMCSTALLPKLVSRIETVPFPACSSMTPCAAHDEGEDVDAASLKMLGAGAQSCASSTASKSSSRHAMSIHSADMHEREQSAPGPREPRHVSSGQNPSGISTEAGAPPN